MGKKKASKKPKLDDQPGLPSRSALEKQGDQAGNAPLAPESEKDENFDFGGLPNRNLKKNLGCG